MPSVRSVCTQVRSGQLTSGQKTVTMKLLSDYVYTFPTTRVNVTRYLLGSVVVNDDDLLLLLVVGGGGVLLLVVHVVVVVLLLLLRLLLFLLAESTQQGS